jgi:hypothetical protein
MEEKIMETTTNLATPETKRMTLKEYLGPKWREYFCMQETIREILSATGIDDQQEFLNIERVYTIDEDRLAVVIKTQMKGTLCWNRMILDVIMGEPTWDQMMDITFSIGSECNPKIIVCDPGYQEPFLLDMKVSGFVQINSHCGFPTFILTAGVSEEGIKYTLVEGPHVYEDLYITRLPSKLEFQQTDFMCHVSDALQYDPPLYADYSRWPCDRWIWPLEGYDLEFVFPIWKETGVFMELRGNSRKGQEQLMWLLEHKQAEVKKGLRKYVINYDAESGFPRRIRAKLWDAPFSDFVFCDAEHKFDLVGMILELNGGSEEFYLDLLKDCNIK